MSIKENLKKGWEARKEKGYNMVDIGLAATAGLVVGRSIATITTNCIPYKSRSIVTEVGTAVIEFAAAVRVTEVVAKELRDIRISLLN